MKKSLIEKIKKADEVEKRMVRLISKQESYLSQFKDIIQTHENLKDSKNTLEEIRNKKQKLINESGYVDSIEFFLSRPSDYFEYKEDGTGTYNKKDKYMRNNYKYIGFDGCYNPDTQIDTLHLRIITGHDINKILKEITPVIKLAMKAGQKYFSLFTDDCSESGILSLTIEEEKNEYEVGKTVYGSYRVLEKFDTLKKAIQYIINNKLTYTEE